MKPKLNFILVVGLLFLSGLCYSQEQRFIEVLASDTISLNATQYIYQVSIGEQYEYMGVKIPTENISSDSLPQISEITKALDKGKFNYTIAENDYSITKTQSQPDILIVLNTATELKRLYGVLKPIKGVSGKIKEVMYEPVSKYYNEVYKDMYANAMSQATQLASISGNSIGQLISISYVKNEQENYMDYYKELMKSVKGGITEGENLKKKKEEIKMIFKFGLK